MQVAGPALRVEESGGLPGLHAPRRADDEATAAGTDTRPAFACRLFNGRAPLFNGPTVIWGSLARRRQRQQITDLMWEQLVPGPACSCFVGA